jgi:hypothetical protein
MEQTGWGPSSCEIGVISWKVSDGIMILIDSVRVCGASYKRDCVATTVSKKKIIVIGGDW